MKQQSIFLCLKANEELLKKIHEKSSGNLTASDTLTVMGNNQSVMFEQIQELFKQIQEIKESVRINFVDLDELKKKTDENIKKRTTN